MVEKYKIVSIRDREEKRETDTFKVLQNMCQSKRVRLIPRRELKEEKLIGEGSYGDVFLGTWINTASDQVVAIKKLHLRILSEPDLEEFIKEAEIMSKCAQSPYIVRFFGICVCVEKQNYSIVMEYLEKGSLYHILKDTKEILPWNPIRWKIAIDITHGLNYLHSKEILHRDLKSPNVLIDNEYRAKICDFGLAKIKLESSSTSTISKNKLGTTRWRAPELCIRKTAPNKISDIYSLGMILWEISSRQIPFADALDESIVVTFLKDGEKEDIPKDCPKQYRPIIEYCWNEAVQRPSAEQLVEILTNAFHTYRLETNQAK